MIGRRRSRSLFGWCVLVLTPGCASGPIRQLHPLGGDTFTLFPEEQRVPPPIRCSGETDARFECFRQELVERARGIGVAGALALATPDGQMRALGQPDSLNAQVTADTRFPAASVTKMFLAAAAVSLSREGALDLQQPIQRYLPELEQGVGHATLHQLLTHTSGLGNPPLCERASDDLRDLQQKYGAAPLWAPPGVVFNYSNLGYSFVALVLERVTGTPFEQVVQQRVLGPAGIPGASFGPDQVAVRGQHPEQVTLMPRCRAMWPAGGLTLSARELARWAAELAQPAASPLDPCSSS